MMEDSVERFERPGDVIRIDDVWWSVLGVHLGALGQESAIRVRRIGAKESCEGPTLVPERMLRALLASQAATLYRPA